MDVNVYVTCAPRSFIKSVLLKISNSGMVTYTEPYNQNIYKTNQDFEQSLDS